MSSNIVTTTTKMEKESISRLYEKIVEFTKNEEENKTNSVSVSIDLFLAVIFR